MLAEIEELMDKGEGRSPEESRLLELLARLAADFESAHYDLGRSTPGEVLGYLMEQRRMRQVDLVPVLGCSKGAVSDIVESTPGGQPGQRPEAGRLFRGVGRSVRLRATKVSLVTNDSRAMMVTRVTT
jgi:hypothetical protein